MKFRLIPDRTQYLNDVSEVPRAFAPFLELSDDGENFLEWETGFDGKNFYCVINSDVFGREEKSFEPKEKENLLYKKFTKRFVKNFLYDYLSRHLDKRLPYGSLTGVRPTGLYYELMKENDPKGYLEKEFKVSEKRASLIEKCVLNQKGYRNEDPLAAAIFVNVPFCPTRCAYCSFISTEVFRVEKELPLYVETAVRELERIKEIIGNSGRKVSSIYVGGGTPTCLGTALLEKLLTPLKDFGTEFTVEAGRPDTVDAEKVDLLKAMNVTRVSLNPQTFHERTLEKIGRKHTVEEIYRSYELLKDKFSVNADLIAGLPDEDEEDFAYSVRKTTELRPDNVTVHAVSLKRGSRFNEEGRSKKADGRAFAMCDFALDYLQEKGYSPYYMYRQKNTADNAENVGYCLPGTQCRYNIDMMEESITVFGAGAGAVSKSVCGEKEHRIERLANPKGFREYIDRREEVIGRKAEFFNTFRS